MSHMIGKNDKHQGIAQAWHGLTEVHPEWREMTVRAALSTCWLSLWDVVTRPLYRLCKIVVSVVGRDMGDGTQLVQTDNCELTCNDNDALVIGKPVNCQTYSVFTNAKFMALVADCADRLPGAFVASVLSCCDRARIAISLALPSAALDAGAMTSASSTPPGPTLTLTAAKREFEFYLNFLSSHDMSAPLTIVTSSVCTVCNNTFDFNLMGRDGKAFRLSIVHTKNMPDAIRNGPDIVDAFFTSAQAFAEAFDAMGQIACDENRAREFFVGFLAESANAFGVEMSTRRRNQIDRLVELYRTGKGNSGETLADVFSAVTDYYTHESAGGMENPGRQLESSLYGSGATMKAAAFSALKNPERVALLVDAGASVIRETARAEKERAEKVGK